MSETVSSYAEAAERLIKIAGIVALIYLVAMGLDYKWGANWGQATGQHVRQQQGKPILQALPDEDKPTLFWEDNKLITGGLTGLATIAILSLYVVFMLILLRPSQPKLLGVVSGLLTYPNSMAAFFTIAIMYPVWRSTRMVQWGIMFLSLAGAIASLHVLTRVANPVLGLKIQIAILALQSLFTCYASGMKSGYDAADFEHRYPLVEVLTTDAQTIQGLRMIKTGDTECRFVRSDGTEYLIPKAQIRMVRAVSASAAASPPASGATSQPALFPAK